MRLEYIKVLRTENPADLTKLIAELDFKMTADMEGFEQIVEEKKAANRLVQKKTSFKLMEANQTAHLQKNKDAFGRK